MKDIALTVLSPIVEQDFDDPITPPRTVSAHCSIDVVSGYTDFSFVGKVVRCFDKTLSNIYFGREDVYQLNNQKNQDIDY